MASLSLTSRQEAVAKAFCHGGGGFFILHFEGESSGGLELGRFIGSLPFKRSLGGFGL